LLTVCQQVLSSDQSFSIYLFPFNTVDLSVVHIANPDPLNTSVFDRYSQKNY